MDHPFMKTIYAQTFDKEAYAQYLVGQLHVFQALEAACEGCCSSLPLSAVYDKVLLRREALEKDLLFWDGQQAWSKTPSASTARYLQQLHEDSQDPWMLLCHHFLQYNAVLSGGQFLGRMVSGKAGSTHPEGAEFYSFHLADGEAPHARVQRYLEAVDRLDIPDSKRGQMLDCMRKVYQFLLEMFDEAYAVAKVEGVSFAESKAASAKADAGAKKAAKGPPPPPMPAADKAFTASELKKHNGSKAGIPILTSVLGRVYDVTPAKDLFGKGGPYEMFAGRDGTYNLAVMSLQAKTLDVFDYELEEEEKEALADWLAYFDKRYDRPIGVLSDREHSYGLDDLPRATKIPFEFDEDDEDDSAKAPEKPPASRL